MNIERHRLSIGLSITVLGLLVSLGPAGASRTVIAQETAPHWDYEEHGPATWGTLSPEYITCAEGHGQSPIDLTNAELSKAPEVRASYKPASLRIVHNIHSADVINTGHSVQVNFPQGDSLTIGDTTYSLVQFHFHSPSEHTVNGRHFPMEMHLVHKSADGRLAVVGVLLEEGALNKAYEPIFTNLPSKRGVETHLEHVTVDVQMLLPRDTSSYRYDGSLTTPPCSEGVKWIVLKAPVQLSAGQIKAFNAVLSGNSRPVQPLHGRKVVLDHIKEN